MKKMTQQEVDAFIRGEGLIEIEIDDPGVRMELEALLKKRQGYIATAEGTFKIHPDLLKELLELGFEIQEITADSLQ